MSEAKKFEIIGGKVVRSAQPNGTPLTAMGRCTYCKIKDGQVAEAKDALFQANKKIGDLKEELTKVQNARAEKKEAYSVVDIQRSLTNAGITKLVRTLVLYLRYVRIVLWTLKVLRDHPPGGFCVACEQPDGAHDQHCLIAKLFDDPGQVILEHKDVKIDERDLPIPEELRIEEVEPLIDRPWGIACDMKKECREFPCGRPPLKGKLWCFVHMPKGN